MVIPSLLKSAVKPVLKQVGLAPAQRAPASLSPAARQSRIGVDVNHLPPDFDPLSVAIFKIADDFTQTSPESVNALVQAVRYLVSHQIEGALVECGVWKGGSAMAMALALKELGDRDRELFLYDTYTGMKAPSSVDIRASGGTAEDEFSKTRISADSSHWNYVALEEVRQNVARTGYPIDRVHFIKGKVEDTIPATIPRQIALLRLDTDFYESTRHELVHLFPLLSPRGVMIVDDYGHWLGARKAVDEYIAEHRLPLLLHRVDKTGVRVAVKAA